MKVGLYPSVCEGCLGGERILFQSLYHIEGWSLTPESLEGHELICILAQRHPPGDPELRWDRVETLAAFWRSSPLVQDELKSAAALIASAGEKKRDKTEVKIQVRARTMRRGE